MTFADDSILVLLDVTPAGELAKSSAGLLGAAATVGTPVALVVSNAPELAEAAGVLGAASVLVAAPVEGLTVPVVDALAAAADLVNNGPDKTALGSAVQ